MKFIDVNNGNDITVKIKPNVASQFSFPVTNVSDMELELIFWKVSCSCTQLDTLTARLAPGDTKTVNGTVLRGTSALFTAQITFNVNPPEKIADIQSVNYNVNIELT